MVYDKRKDFDSMEPHEIGGVMSGIKSRLKALEDYYKDPNYCNECGEIIEIIDQELNDVREQDYCSHSCSAKNHELGVNGPSPTKLVCNNCGNKFDKPRDCNGATYKVKYCSPECRLEKVGHCSQPKSFEKAKTKGVIRKRIIEERGHQCESCGRSGWEGVKIPIHLHRLVDKDYQYCSRDELKLVCPNCHNISHCKSA